MKVKCKILTLIMIFLLSLLTSAVSLSDFSPEETVFSGTFEQPVYLKVFGPVYVRLSQFDQTRTEHLNNLLKHVTLGIILDDKASETVIMVDDDAVLSVTESQTESGTDTWFSLMPDTVFTQKTEDIAEESSSFLQFLENRFFPINRILDTLYQAFRQIPDLFPDMSKSQPVNVRYTGYGKAVLRTTILFPADFVEESFPGALSVLSDSEEYKSYLSLLYFQGAQKITLYYDQEGVLIRATYDGKIGDSPEGLRNISLSWRCLRNGNIIKDDLTLKTPTVKGYDRENMTYSREQTVRDEDIVSMKWDLQIDKKTGTEKQKIRYTADLISDRLNLSGKTIYTVKQDNIETKTEVIPSVQKENGEEYTGTLEIGNYSGKIMKNGYTIRFQIAPCERIADRNTDGIRTVDSGSPEGEAEIQLITESIQKALIRRLMFLPAGDILFLTEDIPEIDLQALFQ